MLYLLYETSVGVALFKKKQFDEDKIFGPTKSALLTP